MKHAFAFALIALPGVASAAMTEMDDAALADVSGEGWNVTATVGGNEVPILSIPALADSGIVVGNTRIGDVIKAINPADLALARSIPGRVLDKIAAMPKPHPFGGRFHVPTFHVTFAE